MNRFVLTVGCAGHFIQMHFRFNFKSTMLDEVDFRLMFRTFLKKIDYT